MSKKKFKLEWRDLLFISIIVVMALLAYHHDGKNEYSAFAIDCFIGAFAIRNWAPWRRF